MHPGVPGSLPWPALVAWLALSWPLGFRGPDKACLVLPALGTFLAFVDEPEPWD